jgi:hypothetical protein
MGTLSTKKFLKNNGSGYIQEENALTTSAGAVDADKIPALNANGFLDPTIINAKTTSAGASDAGKIPALDASGRLDQSFLPVGIGADTAQIVASEALSSGDFVNIYNNGGVANVRKADATTQGKEAHGFVLSGVAAGGNAIVYFEGTNTAVTGKTPGVQFLSTTPGQSTSTAPSASGNVVQTIGFATSPTSINFQSLPPIILA